MRNIYRAILAGILLATHPAGATPLPPSKLPLFGARDPVRAELRAPIADLLREKNGDVEKVKKISVAGTLIVNAKSIPVRIRMRGFSSLGICRFPKLALKFRARDVAGTLLAGLENLDLGTHCDPQSNEEFFGSMAQNHREALLYRWAEILGVPTYAARAARMRYVDTAGGAATEADAFFLEHLDSLLERASAIEVRGADPYDPPKEGVRYEYRNVSDHPQIDPAALGRMSLFQHLIQNGDWHAGNSSLHNLKIAALPGGEWLVVPMDFNFAGIINGNFNAWQKPVDYFPALHQDARRKILDDFLAKWPVLEASLAELGEDAEGIRAFREGLRQKFEEFASLRSAL